MRILPSNFSAAPPLALQSATVLAVPNALGREGTRGMAHQIC